MAKITSSPKHGMALIAGGKALRALQLYLDDITQRLNDFLLGDRVRLTSYVVADIPAATTSIGLIFVSDETGGAVPAFSDGTNWRRCTDRNIVS